jgi:predicted Rdx family selenoprotein
MRKFISILFALVLCVSAMVVIASAATNCPEHDWSAWKTVRIENGDKVQERYCACGAIETSVIHTHKLVKVAAVAPTCEKEGNIEYSYCENCDWMETAGGVATNRLAVILPITHDLQHVEAKAATCLELGNIEYWACKNCDRIEVAGGVLSNIKAVMLPTLAHDIEHVAAKAPTATENGNIEYWYCKVCGYAWLDDLCTKNTNLKAVILPATGEPTAPSNPDTGDNAIYFVVALVAVATLGVAAVSFKKREN